jgi:nitrogen-specific signal transduction histidine kinase
VNVSYLIFYTNDERLEGKNLSLKDKVDNRKASVDELGIISSSIAHELNNPLAGILAAISLLNLEEIWSGDELSDLEDMKNGAKRCKELVEIFLGFSKFSPKAALTASIKQSADQAINLLRFRMIESNLRLELKYTPTLETFSRQINSSIMSMILYLILSELMTSFAHERLINQSNLSLMSGEILEFSNQIILKLDQDFEYEDKLAQSKLIQHLLLFEKLEINFLTKEIRLIYRG